MNVYDKFRTYIWLVDILQRYGPISFQEIQRHWLETEWGGGVAMPKATFARHRMAIEEMFGLCVECDARNEYRYFIDNQEVLHEDTVQNWMLSTLTVGNLLSDCLSVQDRILLEQVPCAKHLMPIVEAMKRKVRIVVAYRKYGADCVKQVEMEPYCIKLFRRRWYVLGHFHREATSDGEAKDYCALYAFDRMLEVKLTETTFEMRPDFQAKAFFAHAWGIFVDPDVDPERVVVRVYDQARYYLRDLPIHASQRSLGEGVEGNRVYEDFELHVCLTWDFCSHLLSKAHFLKVLEPSALVSSIREMLHDSLALYEEPGKTDESDDKKG